jgi:hypothetical protein
MAAIFTAHKPKTGALKTTPARAGLRDTCRSVNAPPDCAEADAATLSDQPSWSDEAAR